MKYLIGTLVAISLGLALGFSITPPRASEACNGAPSLQERLDELKAIPGSTADEYKGTAMTDLEAIFGAPPIDHDEVLAATIPNGDLSIFIAFDKGCEVMLGKVPLDMYRHYKETHQAGTNG